MGVSEEDIITIVSFLQNYGFDMGDICRLLRSRYDYVNFGWGGYKERTWLTMNGKTIWFSEKLI